MLGNYWESSTTNAVLTIRRLTGLAVLAVSLAATGCGDLAGGKPSPSPIAGTATSPPVSAAASPAIRVAQLVGPKTGWVLTERDLLRTTDETTWSRVTPPDVSGEAMLNAYFSSPTDGWVVHQIDDVTLQVLRTTDGGSSWSRSAATAVRSGAVVPGIQFVDSQDGWFMARYPSSSNFSFGQLFRTTDGGSTWRANDVPVADAFRFSSPMEGWLSGGPAGNKLFVTHDGGATWTARSVVPPPAFAGDQPVFGPPRFLDQSFGVLPVSFAGTGTSGYAIYGTSDAGSSWNVLVTFASTRDLSSGDAAAMTLEVTPSFAIIVGLRDRVDLRRSTDRGRSWQQVNSSGLPVAPTILRFADNSNGWALASAGICQQKQACTTIGGLHTSHDGGATWKQLQP